MPDAIATIDGKAAMAYNGKNGIPWHQLGTALPDAADADTMIKAAGLDWNVVKQPLFTYGVGQNSTALLPVKGRVATVRDIDSHVIATVGETYQPIQNRELFDFAEVLMDTGESVKFETAGALFDGRIAWALAVIEDQAIRIDGDDSAIMPYLVLSTGHDGLRAFMASFTPVRVVCANTLAMAMKGARETYVIRHTVKALDKIEDARKALRLNVEYLQTLKAVSETLMKARLSKADAIAYTEALIPTTAEDPEKAVKAQRQRDELLALYRNSQTLDGVTRPDTRYRMLQATAEWVDHSKVYRATKKGSAQDARALAILDGQGAALKDRGLALLLPAAAKRDAKGHFVKASAE